MIDPTALTDQVLLQSLRSTTCPCCGGRKLFSNTLCGFDYHRLPRPMAQQLYQRIDSGKYKPAILEALKYLEAKIFHLPREAAA